MQPTAKAPAETVAGQLLSGKRMQRETHRDPYIEKSRFLVGVGEEVGLPFTQNRVLVQTAH